MLGLESVYWGITIVTYPFVSGLVAGSFIVGSLSHVFGQKQYEPLTKLSLLVTLTFLLLAPLGPLADARQPERWWELFLRPHLPYSPLGLFTAILSAYIIVVLVEMYITYRVPNMMLAQHETGWKAKLYRTLSLGSADVSEGRMAKDNSWLKALSVVGILLAFAFHGYVGFLFGSIKARPLWSNSLMMPLFIVSAIVSGIALMVVLYTITYRYLSEKGYVDPNLLDGLMRLQMWMIFVDLFFDVVDILNSIPSAYANAAISQGWHNIFIVGPLAWSYWFGQIGLLVLGLILTCVRMVRVSPLYASLTSLIVLISVFMMRYNTVIGGQLQPKVSQGLVSYSTPLFGPESWQVIFGIFMLAIFILTLLLTFLPWDDEGLAARLRQVKVQPVQTVSRSKALS
ncbi:MAG: polysulfide reductase NrfD [Peptococcaceae bacterium]|jgi:predicted membrane protein|nr:polysulfide reductase NrfD [Peptococcaceae bacterium]